MIEDKENLKELISNFFGSAQGSQIKRDIELGDEIFRRYPAPRPREKALGTVRNRIAVELARKKRTSAVFLTFVKISAVAAVVIVTALAGLMFFASDSGDIPVLAKHIWQDDTLEADPQLLTLKAQVDEIADQIQQIRLDELGEYDDADTAQWEIEEMEMVANNTDFWKG